MASGQSTQQRQHTRNGNGQVDESDLTGHDFHLLVADAAIPECYEVFQRWPAVCGKLLSAGELPASTCPPDCQREVTYCIDCLRLAVERNDEAGVLPEVLGTRLG
jgi:hypothetical protein